MLCVLVIDGRFLCFIYALVVRASLGSRCVSVALFGFGVVWCSIFLGFVSLYVCFIGLLFYVSC